MIEGKYQDFANSLTNEDNIKSQLQSKLNDDRATFESQQQMQLAKSLVDLNYGSITTNN